MSRSRYLAAKIIQQVLNGKSLTPSLNTLDATLALQDQAFVKALCFGVCRYYYRLRMLFQSLVEKPLREKDKDVYSLILVGLYQLLAMNVPAHAAVSETVAAVELLKKDWAKKFVNGVLRNYLRRQAELDELITHNDEAFYMHPQWWLKKLLADWGDQWKDIVTADNQLPPLAIRVNTLKTTREQYLTLLRDKNIAAHFLPDTSSGLIIETPLPVDELPGFAEGCVTIQDGAAQLAPLVLALSPQQCVLDACAAPGGKLTHLIESEPNLKKIISVEQDKKRHAAILQNIKRLQLPTDKITTICADVADIKTWWDGELFDRILLDAPCSASGVLRRHPDIKLLRTLDDLAELTRQQKRLLKSCFTLLKPGGLLVYATCSVFKDENEDLVKQFLNEEPHASEDKMTDNWGMACSVGRQILPGWHEMDGFYYARLKKSEKR